MLTTSRPRTARAKSPAPPVSAATDQHNGIDEFPIHRAPKRRKLPLRPEQRTIDKFFPKTVTPIAITDERVDGSHALASSNGITLNITTTNGVTQPVKSKAPATKQQQGNDGEVGREVNTDRSSRPTKQDKRTLRSQDDGPRLKSELATYFPNYEEIIFDVAPDEAELLDVNTTIYITDDASAKSKAIASPQRSSKAAPSRSAQDTRVGRIERLDFSTLSKRLPGTVDDPLSDDAFLVSHRRAERKEKQMRNIEKEHAMHEKVQLDRLLDGLLGHDWLRVLGITGVTESEAKKFEPKRRLFIAEVQALVDKFKQWRDEERRQRLQKEARIAAELEAEQAGSEDVDGDDVTDASTSNTPSTDLNASAARQLQQETASAMRMLGVHKIKTGDWPASRVPPPPLVPDRPPSPITSFYAARHLRESALKRARNSRNQLAFGQLLPDMDEEEEFALPDDYISEEVLRASARERRRRKREKQSQD